MGIRVTMGTFEYVSCIFRVGERCRPGTRGTRVILYIHWVLVLWGEVPLSNEGDYGNFRIYTL